MQLMMHLIERDATLLHEVQRLAAVQHLLVEPAPGPLPGSPWVHCQSVEHHGHAGQATVSRLILRAGTLSLRYASEC